MDPQWYPLTLSLRAQCARTLNVTYRQSPPPPTLTSFTACTTNHIDTFSFWFFYTCRRMKGYRNTVQQMVRSRSQKTTTTSTSPTTTRNLASSSAPGSKIFERGCTIRTSSTESLKNWSVLSEKWNQKGNFSDSKTTIYCPSTLVQTRNSKEMLMSTDD